MYSRCEILLCGKSLSSFRWTSMSYTPLYPPLRLDLFRKVSYLPRDLPRVSAKPFCVDERRPDAFELQLDVLASDKVLEQIVLKDGAIEGANIAFRIEVLRQ